MARQYVINGKVHADLKSGRTGKIDRSNIIIVDILLLTLIINITIPKAGIKYNGIPITVGNILFAVLLVIGLLFVSRTRFSLREIVVGGGIAYWFIRLLFSVLFEHSSDVNVLPFFTALVIYPAMYFVIRGCVKTQEQANRTIEIIDKCLFAVMIYAIIQFIFGVENTAIPGITVNYTDYIEAPTDWWLNKANGFADGTKIFSTYQNGNIFGLNLLLLFPISYRSHGKYSGLKLFIFIVCCFLSGSRSVIIGCILYLIILLVRNRKITKKKYIWGLLFIAVAIPAFVMIITMQSNLGLLSRIGSSLDWNVFVSGSGRTASALTYFSWLFKKFRPLTILFGAYGTDYTGGAYEMTYICIFVLGGIIGLLLFVYPAFNIVRRIKRKLVVDDNDQLRGIYEGIILYFIIAFIEGAYWLPPTALNVWSVISLGQVMVRMNNIRIAEKV